jgi:hypothetical protein
MRILCQRLDFTYRSRYKLFWRQEVSIDNNVSILPGVLKPLQLGFVFALVPVKILAFKSGLVGYLQKDENIRPGKAVPHVRYIRMLLGDVPASIPLLN